MFDNTGMGGNPGGPEMPLGLGFLLVQTPLAMTHYGRLSLDQQELVVRYVQGGATGEEAQQRMERAAQCLENNDIRPLLD